MAQPTAYEPAHEFLTDEVLDSTFPGTELDVEFNAIDITLTQVLANLALIQRDDGALANGVVTYDSLSASLQTNGLAPATGWVTATEYEVGDAVIQAGTLYRALVEHTSGTFATDLADEYWEEIADLPVGDVDFSAISTATIVSADYLLFGDVSNSEATRKVTLSNAIAAYSSQLAAIAALTPTDSNVIVGNGSTWVAESGSTARASLGLTIGTHVQAYDATLASIAALGTAADKLAYTTGTDTWAETALTSFARSILDDADEATFKATVNLEIGVDVQAYDAGLADVAGLTPTDGNIIVGNGTTWVAESGATARASLGLTIGTHVQAYDADLTTWAGLTPSANAQSLVTAANYAAMRGLLDLEAGTDFYSIAAADAAFQPLDSDLTSIAGLSTTAAGRSVLTIADPGVDRVVAWDDTAGSMAAIALADITAEASPAAGDYLLIYGAEGDLRKVDWDDLPGAAGGIAEVSEDTTPQLGGDLDANTFNIGFDDATGIEDDAGNEQLIFQKTASAVNHIEITNAATGNDPTIAAAGDDTNIDLVLAGKGTGVPKIGANAIIDAGDTASDSVAGIVELATTAEALTGTDTARAVTPAGLAAATIMQGLHSIPIPASAMLSATTSGPARAQFESSTNDRNFIVLDFDASADEHAHFNITMPKSWNEGTITFNVEWMSSATDTDGVAWALEATSIGDNESTDASWGTAVVVTDDAQSAASELYVTATSSALTVGGTPAAGEDVFFRVFRDVSDANDDMTEDARLIKVNIFITLNAPTDA